MNNKEKLNIIYERMWWYTNPRKDDKTWWTIYDQNPVRIGDVIEYIRLKNIWDINPIADEWDYPRLSIDEQSDDCISFVYNLIKK